MKFWEILRFEVKYQIGRIWTWLFFVVLLVISFMMTRDGTLAEALHDDFFINSPFAIAKTTVVGSLLWLLVAGAVAGEAAARDVATGMYSLVYTTPVTRTQYLAGRFFAALFLNLLILLSVQLGIAIAVYFPGVDAELIGPFRITAYLTAFVYLVVPHALLATAVQFMVASRAGRPMTAYLGSFLIFFMSYIFATFMFFQGRRDLANLLDPIGVHFVLSDLSHMWTTVEKSWRLLALEGIILMNRLLWTGVAFASLAATYFAFRFSHRTVRPWISLRTRKIVESPTPEEPTKAAAAVGARPAEAQRASGFSSSVRKVLAITSTSFKAAATSWAGLFMLIVIPLLSIPVVADQMETNGVPLIPTTIRVLNELAAPMVSETARWVIIPLLIIFFAGELMWRERNNGMGEITDATPGSEWMLFLGKFLGLVLVLLLFFSLQIAAGTVAQLAMGYHEIDFQLYLKVMLGLQLTEALLFVLLAMMIHVVADQKYIGHLAAIVAYTVIAVAPMFGIEHNLLIYGASPGWSYTEMRGFGASLGPWLWFKFYWFGWALLFAVTSRLFWVRGLEKSLNLRLRLARERVSGGTIWITGLAVAIVIAVGAFIFYNTNILNEYRTEAEHKKRSAEYELKYGRYSDVPQLDLCQTLLEVDIYPKQGTVDINGLFHLTNLSQASIDTIHVAIPEYPLYDVQFFSISSTLITDDKELQHRVYVLDNPVLPGDSILFHFRVHVEPRGFTENGADNSVLPNGTYFMIQNWLPAVGYKKSRELSDAGDRREYGLVARPLIPSLYDAQAPKRRSSGVQFQAIISTDNGQMAVAPGNLNRNWSDGQRSYFDYSTDGPIGSEWAIFSANYKAHEFLWNNPDTSKQQVAVRIFHHPTHTGNVEKIASSVRASLDYYTEQFGPYRHNHLSVVEYPGNGTGMHAEPTMITHQEGFTQWAPKEGSNGPDLPYAVVAHEMGHQWGVPLAFVEGAPVVAEGVAWYYGMKLVENARGEDQLDRLRHFMQQPHPYPPIRRGEPLLRGLDPYLSYRRCPFALYALSEYIGEHKVNHALRQLLEKHLPPDAPLATTLDLYRELQSVTPDSMQYLLHDLFEVNTYWDLQTKSATVKQLPAGEWQLSIDLEARKVTYDSTGIDVEVSMKDWIELGVFGADGNEEPFYLQIHQIQSGKQLIELNLLQEPRRVEIDPNRLLIDLEPEDNATDVRNN